MWDAADTIGPVWLMRAKIWPHVSEGACGYEELIKSKQLEGTVQAVIES